MNYYEIKKLDEESLERMKEATGPVDECICSLLAGQSESRRGTMRNSIKRAISKVKHGRKPKGVYRTEKGQSVVVPISFKGDKGSLKATKEVIKRKGTCGKCGCDKNDFTLKHSYANIRITTPDITTLCPCPSNDCMPEKSKLLNNIKVTVERVAHDHIDLHLLKPSDPDSEDSETSLHKQKRTENVLEPEMSDKMSLSSLINAQYESE
ncbi:uncharacterized protein LOC142984970 [Anticarsia gemmatalis]|uniref:uncharacterized protein LOC142984970 n=1 Tax=Anticarsia gemmatalis TaxID=129554 RepID=UPI003F75CE92